MTFVSIIIPTFNRKEHLIKAIESVFRQTYRNWELIVVDDCSTDDSFPFVQKYFEGKKIRFLQTPKNGGQGAARNFGIEHSMAEYIAFLDSDDEWEPLKLEKQVQLFNANDENLGLVYCGGTFTEGNFKSNIHPDLKGYIEKELFLNLKGLGSSNSGIMIRRIVFEKVGGYDVSFKSQMDLDFFVRIARNYKVDYIEGSYSIISVSLQNNRISDNPVSVMQGEIQFLQKHESRMRELGVYHHVARKLARKYAIYNKNLKMAYACLIKAIQYKPFYLYAYLYALKLPLLYFKK